jgi:N-acetyltransferase 10
MRKLLWNLDLNLLSLSDQGDLIPWTVGQQFQDPDFPSLSGARVVRLAVHPELPRAGYGTRFVRMFGWIRENKRVRRDKRDEGKKEKESRQASVFKCIHVWACLCEAGARKR